MTATTIIVMSVVLALFITFATGLAYVQTHARRLSTVSVKRTRRRAF
jgi:hypothetical protein